jgi:hypothetical protein
MSSNQRTYRIYCFDRARTLVTAHWIDASSDAEAIARAEAKSPGCQCEVWDGRRMVAEIEAERQQA